MKWTATSALAASLRTAKRLLVGALIGVSAESLPTAQSNTAGVRGTVRDASGVLPGTVVQLVNEASAASRESVTNSAGEYDFAAVPPGTYTVRASFDGFNTFEQRGLRIATQQFMIVDVLLEPRDVRETVTVTARAPLIDRSSASVSTVLNQSELNALPSVARNAYMMSTTVPTVVTSGNQVFTRLQDLNHPSLVSIGGGARRANNYLVDGVSHTDLVNRPSVNPSFEAIDSVNVQVHTYDAEMGRTGGGTYNVTFKSGGNTYQGSAFYQVRPAAFVAENFFARGSGAAKPASRFHNSGGAFGGPIVRGRTFFWFALEGYSALDARNSALRVPTARERAGDFSESVNASGQLVVIYDPLTTRTDAGTGRLIRDPFPGNVITPDRINTVARNILAFYPAAGREESDGSANLERTADQTGYAVMASTKIDHRLSDRASVSALYVTNATSRTNENFWERGQGPQRFADPRDGTLDRRLHLVAMNGTWLVGNTGVLALRYGLTSLRDDDRTTTAFEPSTLGIASAYVNAMQVGKFPRGTIADYEGFGAVDPTNRRWFSWSADGTLSRLAGRHMLKVGIDFRQIGVDTQSFAGGAGELRFDRFYTSSDPLANGTRTSGNALASFLLGYPSGDPGNQSHITVSSPLNAFVTYYGVFAQDDFHVSPRLTLNYGVRVEHEGGLREEHNRFTVAFDRSLRPGGALDHVLVNGAPIRGGLVFAGQRGANSHQGHPPVAKLSPRVGLAYSLTPNTVLRTGYGVYWAPWNYQPVSGGNYGQIGYIRQTFISQGQFVPTTTLDNPFPNGALQPVGNSRGPLTGVGGQIEFVDQDKGAPWVQQYSVDLSRELVGGVAVGAAYVGATGRSLGLGGSNDGVININQLDPAHLALGAALVSEVPNPFFGLPPGEGFAVGSPTVQRRQLLRPFPQFGDILMRQSTRGRSQYHAAIFRAERRLANGWGGRVNYTYSRLMDNQFGETNYQQPNTPEALNAYDLEAEYSRGILDVPHKLSLSPTFELPFGDGKRWLADGLGKAILGGWTVTSVITLESGFPVPVASSTNNTNLFSRTQRPNRTAANPATTGTRDARIRDRWLNPAAYEVPPAFTLGTAPRVDGTLRGPHRHNWDLAVTRTIQLRGSVRGEIRVETINVTNTVKAIGPIHTVGSSGFGQIRAQSGFMRLTQVTFRLTF